MQFRHEIRVFELTVSQMTILIVCVVMLRLFQTEVPSLDEMSSNVGRSFTVYNRCYVLPRHSGFCVSRKFIVISFKVFSVLKTDFHRVVVVLSVP